MRGDILLIARIFPGPRGARKIQRDSQNIRRYYMLNHRIRCIYPRKAEFVTELLIYCNAIKTDTDSHDTDGQTWPHLQRSS